MEKGHNPHHETHNESTIPEDSNVIDVDIVPIKYIEKVDGEYHLIPEDNDPVFKIGYFELFGEYFLGIEEGGNKSFLYMEGVRSNRQAQQKVNSTP